MVYSERRPRSPVTSQEEDRRIVQAAEHHPLIDTKAIREELSLDVSAETVRLRLHQAGIHHCMLARTDYLTDAHSADRLTFALQYVGKEMEF